MNPAYKNLDSRLRVADLTIGQWLGVVLGVMVGLAWALYLSPFGTYVTLATAVYIGAIPAGAVLLAGISEFDLWLLMRSAIRWRWGDGRFVGGPGSSARGYVIEPDTSASAETPTGRDAFEADLAALWE